MRSRRTSYAWLIVCHALLFSTAALAQSIEDYRLAGRGALQEGRFVDAIEAFGEGLKVNPNDLDSTIGMSEAYYGLGEYDEASRYAERARILAGRTPRVLTLSGRIAIGLGNVDLAESLFLQAMEIEPNNVEAEIGLAELAVAGGRSLDAIQSLETALRYRPEDRKALLSLALVYEATGNLDLAQRYFETALRLHGDSPDVQILAAEFALRHGRTSEAASRARSAQALDAHNQGAIRIRASVALLEGRNLEALASAQELIRARRTDAVAWYLQGQANLRLGQTDEAMDAFLTALRYSPEEETIRLVAEGVALDAYGLDDPVRAQLAQEISGRAADFASGFRYSRALAEYQRALRLTPLDSDLRRRYAELYRTLGLSATYLQELTVIRDNGDSSAELERTISVFQNQLSESVSNDWSVDQFTMQRTATRLGVYLLDPSGAMRFPASGEAILGAAIRQLSAQNRLEVVQSGTRTGFTDAFSSARAQDVDFFILVELQETDRTFAIGSTIYVGRTGSQVARVSIARGGPDRVAGGIDSLVRRVAASFPVVTEVRARKGRRILLDVGTRDSVEPGLELTVFDPASVMRSADSITFGYSVDNAIGTIAITRVDDLVAEGLLTPFGIVDKVVVGDVAIRPSEGSTTVLPAPSYPILYDRIRALR